MSVYIVNQFIHLQNIILDLFFLSKIDFLKSERSAYTLHNQEIRPRDLSHEIGHTKKMKFVSTRARDLKS